MARDLPVSAMPPPPELPLVGVAGEIEEVIGRAQTINLVIAMRGSTGRSWRVCIYVPKRLHIDHELVRILGWKDARRLCHAFGGEILQTSNLRYLERNLRHFAVWKLSVWDGYPVSLIAEYLAVTASAVRKILSRKPPEGFAFPQEQNGSGEAT